MIYRVFGGLFLLLFGLTAIAHLTISPILLAILALVAGIALLAGV